MTAKRRELPCVAGGCDEMVPLSHPYCDQHARGRVQACPNEHTTGTCQGCKDYAAPVQSGRGLSLPCHCWPDYSTPDAPSLDANPECPRHRDEIAESAALAATYAGEDPF